MWSNSSGASFSSHIVIPHTSHFFSFKPSLKSLFLSLSEVIDASFRKPDDVYAAIGIPVLASIPRISER